MKILRNQQFRIGYCKQTITHAFRSLLLELHLRVTVGALQKRRIAMTGEVCDRIFVHALMQKRRDKKVAQCMQMVAFRKSQFRKQRLQVLAERVRVDGCAVVFRENVFREWDTMLIAESHFAVKDSIRFTSADFSAFSDTQLDRLFSEDFYGTLTVAIIRFQSASTVLDWSEFLPPDGWTVIDLEACPKQRIILLWIPVMPNEGISSAEYYFQELAVKLPCSISYGDFSSNPLEIARLYDMAKQAQRYAGSTPVTSYASVRQLCEDQPAVQYPYQILDDLSICLRQLDFRKARDEVSSIVSTSAAYPVLFVRCIYMDILSLLNTSMHAYSVRYEAYEPLLNEALRICRSMRAANDQTAICRSIQSILDKFEVESLSTGLQLPQVVAFVEEHCFKADFSLAYLANHFHVGPVYMSTFFTKRMNTTLTDYVWELRLQRAKYLLESTEESIDKISAKIGYNIPSSFRRKFKQETGTSPSEYRRTHHVN